MYEPSMEEILASIRRIIADDHVPGAGPALFSADEPTAEPAHEPPPEDAPAAPVTDRLDDPPETHEPPAFLVEPAEPSPAEPSPAGPSPEPHAPALNVFELTPQVAPAPQPSFDATFEDDARAHDDRRDDGHMSAPLFMDEPVTARADEPVTARTVDHEAPARDAEPEKAPLFSEATDSAVSSAFKMLAASRIADSSDEIMTLARDMIRPLLRTWIDDNLPGMVERMVRAEIERVARGGR